MERDLAKKLSAWKDSKARKPLILQGARQVGKTYLLRWFGEHAYEDCAYFNFEEDPRLKDLFTSKLDPATILQNLEIYRGKKIHSGRTLIVFDEVQNSSQALTSLKYFQEFAPQFHIAAAGSLLGVQLSRETAFPVGKVDFLRLYPLSFFEFLGAVGKDALLSLLRTVSGEESIPGPFHEELVDWLKKYFVVGGMPEAVRQFVEEPDWAKIRGIQSGILRSYELDFAKYAPPSDLVKINAIWASLPRQLAKENKKFKFSEVKKGARAREYESALQWLMKAGLAYPSYDISAPKFPLSAQRKESFFKVFLFETGLAAALAKLSPTLILERDALFTDFHGILTENFVAQELFERQNRELHYWTSSGIAEVDFILSTGKTIFPLEVKAGTDKRKKSLAVYIEKYRPKIYVRSSLRNLKKEGSFYNIPLYLASRIPELVSRH